MSLGRNSKCCHFGIILISSVLSPFTNYLYRNGQVLPGFRALYFLETTLAPSRRFDTPAERTVSLFSWIPTFSPSFPSLLDEQSLFHVAIPLFQQHGCSALLFSSRDLVVRTKLTSSSFFLLKSTSALFTSIFSLRGSQGCCPGERSHSDIDRSLQLAALVNTPKCV